MLICGLCKKRKRRSEMTKAGWACRPCWRGYMRLKRYGLTPEQFAVMKSKQGGVCAICGEENFVKKKSNDVTELAVDEGPNGVRGLLCGMCNRGLGYFRDDPSLLSRAVRYLVGWSS